MVWYSGCRLTDVGSIDETEEVQQHNCWDDHEVNLGSQLGLCFGIELNERIAISII